MELERLVRVSTYAKMKDVTVQTVMNWIEKGKVDSVLIDGMRFVMMEDGEW